MGKDGVRTVQVHLHLLGIDHIDPFQDASHGGARQARTAASLLLPGLEAEFDVFSSEWLAIMERDARPDGEGDDVTSIVRLPVGDDALFAQLPLIIRSDEWVIHIADIGQHGGGAFPESRGLAIESHHGDAQRAPGRGPGHVPSLGYCRRDETYAGNDDHYTHSITHLLHATPCLSVPVLQPGPIPISSRALLQGMCQARLCIACAVLWLDKTGRRVCKRGGRIAGHHRYCQQRCLHKHSKRRKRYSLTVYQIETPLLSAPTASYPHLFICEGDGRIMQYMVVRSLRC